jgi:BirA family biotin operon repressor/biotin-[acetyl-CoA-carboxylase] ligase
MKNLNRKIFRFSEINSTQNYAKKIAARSDAGTIVLAAKQTKGRGRFEKEWASPEGGLYFSIILKPACLSGRQEIKPDKIPLITYKMALAIVDSIKEKTGKKYDVFIKPPNDVIVKHKNSYKKIAGILTESSIIKNKIEWVVLGAGININNKIPKNLKNAAVSLKEITGKKYASSNIFNRITKKFEKYYFMFSDYKLVAEYKKKLWKPDFS